MSFKLYLKPKKEAHQSKKIKRERKPIVLGFVKTLTDTNSYFSLLFCWLLLLNLFIFLYFILIILWTCFCFYYVMNYELKGCFMDYKLWTFGLFYELWILCALFLYIYIYIYIYIYFTYFLLFLVRLTPHYALRLTPRLSRGKRLNAKNAF